MALRKVLSTIYGVNIEYHKIAVTNIDWHKKTAHLELLSFVSEDTRRTEGGNPLITLGLDIKDSNIFPFTVGGNILEEAYGVIKQNEEWVDAVDC